MSAPGPASAQRGKAHEAGQAAAHAVSQAHHERFQVERFILFSDAVFAIAITLLVIDLKVPELHDTDITEAAFWQAFAAVLPKLLAFVISFFVIGTYWTVHHRLFRNVVVCTRGLMWLNLLFLFAIALMPFSTSVSSEYSSVEHIKLVSPFAVYVADVVLIGAFNFALWVYIANPRHAVTDEPLPRALLRASLRRSMVLPVMFVLALLLSVPFPGMGRFVLFLIPVAMRLAGREAAAPARS